MARLGLGAEWRCLLANDIDRQKCAAYRENFGGDDLIEGDISAIAPDALPAETADLVWASFPCQDLSLAGARAGMRGKRSGAFFAFWRHVETLIHAGRAPKVIAIENVTGLLTSNGGADFAALAETIAGAGYAVGALVVDAAQFTPQSRPRIFVFGFSPETAPPEGTAPKSDTFTPAALIKAHEGLAPSIKQNWRWIDARPAHRRNKTLSDILDWESADWAPAYETARLLSMMSPRQRAGVDALLARGARRAGAAFRRTRIENGEPVQRLEARFDDLAGCLRTPAGGSSRQIVIAIENGAARTRLLNPREAARLMGLPEDYRLPKSTSAALKLCGDGVVAPVVNWLAEAVIAPALEMRRTEAA